MQAFGRNAYEGVGDAIGVGVNGADLPFSGRKRRLRRCTIVMPRIGVRGDDGRCAGRLLFVGTTAGAG